MTFGTNSGSSRPEEEVFCTKRLRVRKWSNKDFALIKAVYSDPNVIRWVDDGQPISTNDVEAWILKTHQNYETYGYGMFAIEHAESKRPVGFGGIVHPFGQEMPEIKYALLPSVWGQGLATEFVQEVLAYAASAHGITSFIATVSPENAASKKVLLKSGFSLGHTITDDRGEPTDVYCYDARQPN